MKFMIVLSSGAAALAVGLGVELQSRGSDILAMISNALSGIG
ncbi:MAG TPA: hypothetical protein VNW53_08810 [Phenylobacterium sp.]|nr:hypothetical protein [Phenylobacterium sp.]HXA39086.1 hypothetical protein [Phenylobacterium sp.]